MKTKTTLSLMVLITMVPFFVSAQDDGFEKWRKQQNSEFEQFKKERNEEFEEFRRKINMEYAQFLKQRWAEMEAFKGIKPPEDTVPPVPPIVCPDDEREKVRKDIPQPIDIVVKSVPPSPQPAPPVPVKPPEPPKPEPPSPPEPTKPIPPVIRTETISFAYYGTKVHLIVDSKPKVSFSGDQNTEIADVWEQLSSGQCEKLLTQCIEMRTQHELSDWGYIQFLDSLSQAVFGRECDEATMLMAWLYCQSGYKMRLGRTPYRIHMLFASTNIIYGCKYYTLKGERYYVYKEDKETWMKISPCSFPKEQSMSIVHRAVPKLQFVASPQKTLKSSRYKDFNVATSVNKNLIDYYNSYPEGTISENPDMRWAFYANTPLSDEVVKVLYPQIRNRISGKNRLQSTEELLNFVQTAFPYGYDDSIWGDDRAFFPEETLFYPFSDCEDHAILFSRLVRDLVGLKVVLVLYPGHLAAAVRFEEEKPTGDYFRLSDGDYYVSDPTYIGAKIGMTMPKMNNGEATIIRLE